VLVKACVQFEGVCRRLDPEFDVLDLVDGLLVSGAVSRLRDRDTAMAGVSAASDLLDLALFAPRAVSRVLSKAAHGQLTARVEHRGAEEFTEHLDKMANRLAYSLLVSASIIGSALLVQTEIGPKVGEFPVLGVGAFGVSACLAGVLLWNILRSGRLK
jgi:ubiquinone biosynthesis protein